jgi:hypothetical protein
MGVSFFALVSACFYLSRVFDDGYLLPFSIRLKKTGGFAEQTIAGTAVDSASLGLERIGASPLLLRNQR